MILGLFLLGSLRRTVRSGAALAGLVAGFLTVLLVWLPAIGNKAVLAWLAAHWGGAALPRALEVWAGTPLAWPWYAPIGTVVTVVIALFVDSWGNPHGSSANGGTKPGLRQSG
jgi:hypothetical protein